MNPVPEKILAPTTANRIPWTENAQAVVTTLLEFQINASAFLMDAEHLESLATEDFTNDFDCAFEDFFYQIPEELRWKVFPLELETEVTSEGNSKVGDDMSAMKTQTDQHKAVTYREKRLRIDKSPSGQR